MKPQITQDYSKFKHTVEIEILGKFYNVFRNQAALQSMKGEDNLVAAFAKRLGDGCNQMQVLYLASYAIYHLSETRGTLEKVKQDLTEAVAHLEKGEAPEAVVLLNLTLKTL